MSQEIVRAVEQALTAAIDGARVAVRAASPGHYEIDVIAAVFAGKNRLESQRLVLSSIKHLMSGDAAPVHAVDRITTRAE